MRRFNDSEEVHDWYVPTHINREGDKTSFELVQLSDYYVSREIDRPLFFFLGPENNSYACLRHLFRQSKKVHVATHTKNKIKSLGIRDHFWRIIIINIYFSSQTLYVLSNSLLPNMD